MKHPPCGEAEPGSRRYARRDGPGTPTTIRQQGKPHGNTPHPIRQPSATRSGGGAVNISPPPLHRNTPPSERETPLIQAVHPTGRGDPAHAPGHQARHGGNHPPETTTHPVGQGATPPTGGHPQRRPPLHGAATHRPTPREQTPSRDDHRACAGSSRVRFLRTQQCALPPQTPTGHPTSISPSPPIPSPQVSPGTRNWHGRYSPWDTPAELTGQRPPRSHNGHAPDIRRCTRPALDPTPHPSRRRGTPPALLPTPKKGEE